MEKIKNLEWTYIVDEEKEEQLKDDKMGEWIVPCQDLESNIEKIENIVKLGLSPKVRYQKGHNSQFQVYANEDDHEANKNIIEYLIEQDLIPKYENGCLYDIDFKYDPEYIGFVYPVSEHRNIRLSDYHSL